MNEMKKKHYFYKYAEEAYDYLLIQKTNMEEALEDYKKRQEDGKDYWEKEIRETEASIEAINDLLKRIEKL